MAARPNPYTSHNVCQELAANSIRRLEKSIEVTSNAIESNERLTTEERKELRQANAKSKKLIALFAKICEV